MTQSREDIQAQALRMFSDAASILGLTDAEAAILGAQFAGLVIAKMQPASAHSKCLELAATSMLDTYSARRATDIASRRR